MLSNMDRFVVMNEWGEALSPLTDEQVGKVFRIMLNYNKGIEVEINDPSIKAIWNLIKPNIDRINTKYQASIENGKKGGRPKKPNNNLTKPNNNLTETYKEKEKEKENIDNIEHLNTGRKTILVDWSWDKADYVSAWNRGDRTIYDKTEITKENIDEIVVFD